MEKIKKYLKKHKLSVKQFCNLIGINRNCIRRYLNGERFPEPAVIKAIYKVTKGEITPNDIYGIRNSKNEQANS